MASCSSLGTLKRHLFSTSRCALHTDRALPPRGKCSGVDCKVIQLPFSSPLVGQSVLSAVPGVKKAHSAHCMMVLMGGPGKGNLLGRQVQ